MKMMVYKDKEKILKKLYSILESIGKENGLYIFLLTPKNAHSLKEYICNNNIDVMLLDIFIEEDVLNLMKKTSESNQKMKMIFTPLMYHNILKCYEIKVIKNNITPVDKDKIDPIVKDWSNQLIDRNGKFIIEKEKASIGMLQRMFKIGFNRAARIMDQLCDAGVVGPEEGTKPRKVLMSAEEFENYIEEYL